MLTDRQTGVLPIGQSLLYYFYNKRYLCKNSFSYLWNWRTLIANMTSTTTNMVVDSNSELEGDAVLPDFKMNYDQTNIAKEEIYNEHEDANNDDRYWYSVTILFLAVIGFGINITAIIIMRKKKGIFHKLLKVGNIEKIERK